MRTRGLHLPIRQEAASEADAVVRGEQALSPALARHARQGGLTSPATCSAPRSAPIVSMAVMALSHTPAQAATGSAAWPRGAAHRR
jgi:hypothetical protein